MKCQKYLIYFKSCWKILVFFISQFVITFSQLRKYKDCNAHKFFSSDGKRNTDVNQLIKNLAQIHFNYKDHTLSEKMNDNINMN